MIADVERTMIDYGEAGYDCFEIPDFVDNESIVVAYHPDHMRSDAVVGVIMHMPDLLNNNDKNIYWEDGMARLEAFDFSLQGRDAKYIEIHVMGLTDWLCVMQAVVASEETRKFTYADMFDAIRMELVNMGIIDTLY